MFRRLLSITVAILACCLTMAATASAATPGSGLTVQAWATPTSFSAGNAAFCEPHRVGLLFCADAYRATVTNQGSVSTASPITITETLPAGVSPGQILLYWSRNGVNGASYGENDCEVVAGSEPVVVQCHWRHPLGAGETLEMVLYEVVVEPGAGEALTDTIAVSGGGSPEVSTSVHNTYGGALPSFGVSSFSSFIAGLDGQSDTQAGGHPYGYSTTIDLNNDARLSAFEVFVNDTSIHDLKDLVVDLPLGFLGSALAAPQCTLAELSSPSVAESQVAGCPADTQVGTISTQPAIGAGLVKANLYNMVPERGVAAEFGFVDTIHGVHVLYSSVVPTSAGYVLRTTSQDNPQIDLSSVRVTLFGNPAVRDGSGNTPVAMFTNPSECDGEPLMTTVHADSWQEPGSYNADGTPNFSDPNWVSSTSTSPPTTGCDLLHFGGSVTAQPETSAADSPTGVSVDVKVPQSEEPESLATPPLRDSVVTLPAGLSINPSQAGGCRRARKRRSRWGQTTSRRVRKRRRSAPSKSAPRRLRVCCRARCILRRRTKTRSTRSSRCMP